MVTTQMSPPKTLNSKCMEEDLKTTVANTHIEVTCDCPYCNAYLDIFDRDSVRESFVDNDLTAENCDIEITCPKCKEIFIVTDIFY